MVTKFQEPVIKAGPSAGGAGVDVDAKANWPSPEMTARKSVQTRARRSNPTARRGRTVSLGILAELLAYSGG
jgi:hypothetical protein